MGLYLNLINYIGFILCMIIIINIYWCWGYISEGGWKVLFVNTELFYNIVEVFVVLILMVVFCYKFGVEVRFLVGLVWV